MNAEYYRERLRSAILYNEAGKITRSQGILYEAHLPGANMGSLCRIQGEVDAEVVGFRDKRVYLMPYENVSGLNNNSLVELVDRRSRVPVGTHLLGRVVDARGIPVDGHGPLIAVSQKSEMRSLDNSTVAALERSVIKEPLDLGIRSLNALLTCGRGQRLGIMAGSGVGKSVLLGMMSRHTSADVNVIALVGERGREVREFIERDLGPEGLRKSVVVVATSDASPLMRLRAAWYSAVVAEYFRDQGKDVLWLMDSVTRFAMAGREMGLSLGEPPTSKGYPPSVFSSLPKLLERAGTRAGMGSITGLFSVLVEGDDMDEPIADATRSILDGHIVLSRKIAQRNQFPAVDILQSTSRVMPSVVSREHREWAGKVREWLALYNQVEDMIQIGAYVKGSNASVDQAVAMHDRILTFLRQDMRETSNFNESISRLRGLIEQSLG